MKRKPSDVRVIRWWGIFGTKGELVSAARTRLGARLFHRKGETIKPVYVTWREKRKAKRGAK